MMKWKIPFSLALLGMFGGVLIAIIFGVNEDIFKGKIKRDLEQNQKIQQIVDIEERNAKVEKERSKNWRYYQRFHFHATGISAMSLGILIFLFSISRASLGMRLTAGYLTSVGGFLYPFVWLFAAMYGPIIGRGAAKEKFAIFGYMGGLFLLGVLLTLFLIIKEEFKEDL